MKKSIETKLINAIKQDKQYNSALSVTKLISIMKSQLSNRENEILNNFDSVEIDGNLLHIYSKSGDGFTIGYNQSRLGDIVG